MEANIFETKERAAVVAFAEALKADHFSGHRGDMPKDPTTGKPAVGCDWCIASELCDCGKGDYCAFRAAYGDYCAFRAAYGPS